ncbi:MAG: DUF6263 family protein [Flavobacteriaceae bacterium]
MKKVLIALLVITSITTTAQESVLLRLNYTKGDSFLVTTESNQNMGSQGGMNMKMTMGMIVDDVVEDNIKTESQITSIVMDMMQGGMTMSYDSNKNDEELDQMGQMLKSQFAPMMESVIYNTLDSQGNVIDTKLDPAIPGMEQMTNRAMNTINYPKEKVSVGSSWTSENENQGMKMTTKYTVSSIADGFVTLDLSGDMSGVGTGTIKGKSTVEISSGMSINSEIEITIATQGMNITGTTKTTVSKM